MKRIIFRFIAVLSLVFLAACGENENPGATAVDAFTIDDPMQFSFLVCEKRRGVRYQNIKGGADLQVDCNDGTTMYIKNYGL